MAELTIDLGPMVRDGMIQSLVEMVEAMPQYKTAVILRLLKRDETLRVMLAEDLGERALAEDPESSASWDDLMLQTLGDLLETPAGKGEPV